MWGCSANAWSTTSPYGQWKSSNNAYLVDAGTDVQSRLGVFLDQSKVDEVTFTPASSSTLMIVGSLTIQGMDDFCTESLEEWDEWVQVSFGKGDEPAEIENTLKSSEGYLLKDKDGNYLTPKESD